MTKEKCVCGHGVNSHHETFLSCVGDVKEVYRGGDYYTQCRCERFKLDNLALIEELAKERNLI